LLLDIKKSFFQQKVKNNIITKNEHKLLRISFIGLSFHSFHSFENCSTCDSHFHENNFDLFGCIATLANLTNIAYLSYVGESFHGEISRSAKKVSIGKPSCGY